jgi:hypothetical protein
MGTEEEKIYENRKRIWKLRKKEKRERERKSKMLN